jgi:hypothetical protein
LRRNEIAAGQLGVREAGIRLERRQHGKLGCGDADRLERAVERQAVGVLGPSKLVAEWKPVLSWNNSLPPSVT